MSTRSFPTADGATSVRSRAWTVGLPVAVILVGLAVALALVFTGPKAERHTPTPGARLVEVVEMERGAARVTVQAMGPVIAAREVALKAEVVGKVIELSPELLPGGIFHRGDTVLRIDPRDYELAVRQRESDVAEAERDLKLELGQQLVAKREYELLGEVIREEDEELVLRMPQLAAARGRVAAAKAALEQARLDLERTHIVAPFNSIVREKGVDVGDVVTATTVVATLAGTDAYWIEVSVPVDDLGWIDIPRSAAERGSAVTIRNDAAWGPGASRSGRVLRLAGDLEEQGRMARLLVELEDPMSLEASNAGAPVLLIGSYVRAEIEGHELSEVVSLPRDFLHENDTVWVVGEQSRLDVRHVEIAYRGRDTVLVSEGLEHGDRVIRTDLAAPVGGMLLRVSEDDSEDAG